MEPLIVPVSFVTEPVVVLKMRSASVLVPSDMFPERVTSDALERTALLIVTAPVVPAAMEIALCRLVRRLALFPSEILNCVVLLVPPKTIAVVDLMSF